MKTLKDRDKADWLVTSKDVAVSSLGVPLASYSSDWVLQMQAT